MEKLGRHPLWLFSGRTDPRPVLEEQPPSRRRNGVHEMVSSILCAGVLCLLWFCGWGAKELPETLLVDREAIGLHSLTIQPKTWNSFYWVRTFLSFCYPSYLLNRFVDIFRNPNLTFQLHPIIQLACRRILPRPQLLPIHWLTLNVRSRLSPKKGLLPTTNLM